MFAVKQKVEIFNSKDATWTSGTINALYDETRYNITCKYASDKKEVALEDIQHKSMYDRLFKNAFVEGDKVSVTHKMGWTSGKIDSIATDTRYDVQCPSRDLAKGVHGRDIRRQKPTDAKKSEFAIGDRVMATYRNGAAWYPGRVKRVNRGKPCTYSVVFDDGDHDNVVKESNMFSKQDRNKTKSLVCFSPCAS